MRITNLGGGQRRGGQPAAGRFLGVRETALAISAGFPLTPGSILRWSSSGPNYSG